MHSPACSQGAEAPWALAELCPALDQVWSCASIWQDKHHFWAGQELLIVHCSVFWKIEPVLQRPVREPHNSSWSRRKEKWKQHLLHDLGQCHKSCHGYERQILHIGNISSIKSYRSFALKISCASQRWATGEPLVLGCKRDRHPVNK